MAKTQMVALDDLVEDFEIYPRHERKAISNQHIRHLADAIQIGEKLPPIIVDKKTKRIVDGFHRVGAARRLKMDTIEAELRTYTSELDLFNDAVRLNTAHGLPLNRLDRDRSVAILRRLGAAEGKIVEVLRMPVPRLVEITRQFGINTAGEETVVKAAHRTMLSGQTMTDAQEDADERRDGMYPAYHAKQLVIALRSGLWKDTEAFRAAMDELVGLWGMEQKKTA